MQATGASSVSVLPVCLAFENKNVLLSSPNWQMASLVLEERGTGRNYKNQCRETHGCVETQSEQPWPTETKGGPEISASVLSTAQRS